MAHSNDPPGGKTPRCPICRAPSEPGFHPFCSRRCADVDLSRWLRGAYAIPVMDDDDEDGNSRGGAEPIDGRSGSGDVH